MSRRSVISAERQSNDYTAIQNVNVGVVITGTIVDVCGAHNPTTKFIKLVVEKGEPTQGFYPNGIHLIVFDHINKEFRSVVWKNTIEELKIYGEDDNIKGRRITLHAFQNTAEAIENATVRWEREDDILIQNESSYISLSGISGMTVNDWESQMKSFLEPGVGKGRRWNRI
jgi:hypothetical protein